MWGELIKNCCFCYSLLSVLLSHAVHTVSMVLLADSIHGACANSGHGTIFCIILNQCIWRI